MSKLIWKSPPLGSSNQLVMSIPPGEFWVSSQNLPDVLAMLPSNAEPWTSSAVTPSQPPLPSGSRTHRRKKAPAVGAGVSVHELVFAKSWRRES